MSISLILNKKNDGTIVVNNKSNDLNVDDRVLIKCTINIEGHILITTYMSWGSYLDYLMSSPP